MERTQAQAPKTLIRIGHSAYSGDNAFAMCFSKAQAIRELRARVVKRDVARAKVNSVFAGIGGYTTVSASQYSDVIEVCNETRNAEHFMFLREMRAAAKRRH